MKKLSIYFQRIDVDNKMNLNFHYQDIDKTQKTNIQMTSTTLIA